ncbi:MAG TPA: hypothetical protein VIE86_03795 [Nitrososphaera sp.]
MAGLPYEKLAAIRKMFGLARIGTEFTGIMDEGTIYRLPNPPRSRPKYGYVTVSDNMDDARAADIITISNIRGARDRLKKKPRRGIGLEVLIAPVRKLDGPSTARWFHDLYELYAFCQSSGQQLILSSGAESVQEMVAGPCMDAILESCGIDTKRHWHDLNSWLDQKLMARVATF